MAVGYQSIYTRQELETKVKNLEAASGDMTAINNLQTKINGIQTDVDGLKKRVTSLEGTQGTHETRIKKLEDAINNTPDLPSNQDIANINNRIDGIQGDITNIKTDISKLKEKVDVLYGLVGIQTSITASGSVFTLNPDYHYNIITTTTAGQKIELGSNGLGKMKDGQELYVFVNGSNKFTLSVSSPTKIVGLGGEIISSGDSVTPETTLVEISIIKIGSGVYVRLA